MVKLAAPTLEYVLELKSELEDLYRAQDDQIKRMREVRELQRTVPVDEEQRLVAVEVRDPTATDEIWRVGATLSVNPFTVTCKPSGLQTDPKQENATRREYFTEGVLDVAGSRQPGITTFQAAVDACVGDGGCWTKFLFNKDYWDRRYSLRLKDFEEGGKWADQRAPGESERDLDEPTEDTKPRRRRSADSRFNRRTEEAKKKDGPPFAWLCADTLGVYPVWEGAELGQVMEVQERPRSATFRKFRLGRTKTGQLRLLKDIRPEELAQGSAQSLSTTKVCYIELWDSVWSTIVILDGAHQGAGVAAGAIVKQWRHGYGRPPYFCAPGLMMSHWRNRKVGWGVAEAKRWLVEYRSFLWTIHAQIAARDALPPIQDVQQPDPASSIIGDAGMPKPADEKPKAIHWGLREVIKMAAGRELRPLQFPQVAQALKEQIVLVSEAIDKLDTPRVTGNIGSGLEGAGFAINQVLTEAKIRHNPLVQNLERMIKEVIKFMWQLIREKVRERVWVYSETDAGDWLSAGPDDLDDDVTLKVELDPEHPSAKLIENRYWNERLQAGTAHTDQAIEALGDNPDEVRQGRALDRMRQSDWYIKLQDQFVLDEAGIGDLLKEAQAAVETGLLAGMALPPGGVPPGMGSEQIPDMGNLALAPNGVGAAPQGPPNGAVPGAGPGAVVPTQAAAAGMIQPLGG